MLTLEQGGGWWDAFAGANPFSDGTEPFFAELINVAVGNFAQAVLVLDEQEGDPVLTVNLSDPDAFAMVAVKVLPGMNWDQAKSWAEKHIDAHDNADQLRLLGFEFQQV